MRLLIVPVILLGFMAVSFPSAGLQAQCQKPAPLGGQAHPAARGYIVVYHDSVDVMHEMSRLAGLYGVSPQHLYKGTLLKGFAAALTSSQLDLLRCQPSVSYIEHDQPGCLGVAVPAIEITIVDPLTDSADARGVRGLVRDGTYTDSLRPARFRGDHVYALRAATERPGTYSIHLVRPGYHDWTEQGVTVARGHCHVETAHLRAVMVPRRESPR